MEWAAGLQPASPMPTPMRAAANCQKFMAKPDRAVMPLHTARDKPIRLRRFQRSAISARGMPNVA